MSDDKFDWTGSDVVFPSSQGIAIFENMADGITIAQEGRWPEEDILIVIPIDRVEAVANALLQALVVHRECQDAE